MSKMNFVAFALGAAVGSTVTWYCIKKRYEQLAQEEIDSVKAVFSQKMKENETPDSDESKVDLGGEKPNVAEYAKVLSKQGYTDYSKSNSDREDEAEEVVEPQKAPVSVNKPYVISPDQYGDFDDYDQISLTYYADHMLADDNDQLVEDVEDTVGFESLNHFGEYDDDCVCVRNDRLKVDYEILRSLRTYAEVIKSKPYLKEFE